MNVIVTSENKKALFYSALFLIGTGFFVFSYSYLIKYDTGVFLGLSFALLSLICMGFIRYNYIFTAKLLWGIGTPLLIIVSTALFHVKKNSSILSLGDALIGAALFVIYSFHEKREKWGMWLCIILFTVCILFYDQVIINNSDPRIDYSFVTDNYLHFKLTQIFHFISLVYLVLIVKGSKERIEIKLADNIIRFKQFTENMLKLSKNKKVHSGILIESLIEIIPFLATNLNVSRVSIWEYNEDLEAIQCLVCYDDGAQKKITEGGILFKKDFPVYFSHLLSEKMIVADNAAENIKTSEFKVSYLIPNLIKSMMDFPFFVDGKFKGILCYEEQRCEKKWTETDILFAQTLSMYISIIFYCHIRKEQNTKLAELSESLKIQNQKLNSINRKIISENDILLTDLDWKNKDIEQMRSLLNDLSFKNSHHLRGPLSRILGLLHLYSTDPNKDNKELYIEYLKKSAIELDIIIKEIGLELNRNM
ncbi:MAG TPA: GAF domain-containing protein [Ferruginibacter sp.]|nr:GAF domain-containing protein [Ferruginibacter sp.]